MKTTKILRKFRWLLLLAIIFNVACGGGGGGGSSGVSYDGKTSQAVIDSQNATDLALGAYVGAGFGTRVMNLSVQSSSSDAGVIGHSLLLEVPKLMQEISQLIDTTSPSNHAEFSAIHTSTVTIYGDCGGSEEVTVNVDDQTGALFGTLSLDSYCNEATVFSGIITFTGEGDLVTGDVISLRYEFENLLMTDVIASYTLKGNTFSNFSLPYLQLTMDILVKNNRDGQVYWLRDIRMRLDEGTDFVEILLSSGRFYDPDFGYIELSTPITLVSFYGDGHPSEGVVQALGEVGVAGDNTKGRLTFYSPVTCEIEADTDGDGTWDWSSGILMLDGT